MKSITKTSIVLAVLLGSFSAFASTGATNCKVTELHAIEGDNDQYATVKCDSGVVTVLAKSESVKAILVAAKVADKKLNISVSADYAFQKSETLHTIEKVELD